MLATMQMMLDVRNLRYDLFTKDDIEDGICQCSSENEDEIRKVILA